MCFVHYVQNGLALTQTAGQPALSLAISAATPAVQAAQGNSGHPELVQFVKNRAAGAYALTLTFTPNWFANGNGLAWSQFSCESPAVSATTTSQTNRATACCHPGSRYMYVCKALCCMCSRLLLQLLSASQRSVS